MVKFTTHTIIAEKLNAGWKILGDLTVHLYSLASLPVALFTSITQ